MNVPPKPLLFFVGMACLASSQHSPSSPGTAGYTDNAITFTNAAQLAAPSPEAPVVPTVEPTIGPFIPVSEEQANEIRKQHWKYVEGKHLLQIKIQYHFAELVMPRSRVDLAIIPYGKEHSQKVIVASDVYVCEVGVPCCCERDYRPPIYVTLAATPEQLNRFRTITDETVVPIVLLDKLHVE